MTTLLAVLAFAGSLIILLVAARIFTGAAERVGLRLGMSPFAVGVFIVAIGTSLPELVASIVAVRAGTSEIVSGNVIGANASNLMLVLGLTSIAVPGGRILLGERYLFIDLHFLLGATLAVGVSMADGWISRLEGLVLIAAFAVFVAYQLAEGRTLSAEEAHEQAVQPESRRIGWDAAILVATGIAIFVGGDWTVAALTDLAAVLEVSPAVASVTILSIGTTLPEMAVSIIAARRGLASLAVGNILGSCVFNATAVSGVAAALGGVRVPETLLRFPVPFVAATSLLFYLLAQDKRISRWEGMLFIVLFVLFIVEIAA